MNLRTPTRLLMCSDRASFARVCSMLTRLYTDHLHPQTLGNSAERLKGYQVSISSSECNVLLAALITNATHGNVDPKPTDIFNPSITLAANFAAITLSLFTGVAGAIDLLELRLDQNA